MYEMAWDDNDEDIDNEADVETELGTMLTKQHNGHCWRWIQRIITKQWNHYYEDIIHFN